MASALQKNKVRRFLPAAAAFFLLLGFLFTGASPLARAQDAPQLPAPSGEFYLNDAASVIGEGTKAVILQKNAQLAEQYGAQIVVYTVEALPVSGYAQRVEYLRSLMSSWQVGGASDRGLLLALSLSDEDYLAVAGEGLKAEFTTEALKSLLDLQLEADFAAKAYDSGVSKFFLAAAGQVESYFTAHPELAASGSSPASPENGGASAPKPAKKKSAGQAVIFWVCLGAAVVAAISLAVFFLAGRAQARRYSRHTVHRRSPVIYPAHSTVTRHESTPIVQIKSRSSSGAYRTTQKPARSRSNTDWRQ